VVGCEIVGVMLSARSRLRFLWRADDACARYVQNAFIESFNGRLRDECLNENDFATLAEAQGILAAWRERYNTTRPHKALGWKTRREFARSFSIARDKQPRHLSSVV
jgi:transposase InsO family protein